MALIIIAIKIQLCSNNSICTQICGYKEFHLLIFFKILSFQRKSWQELFFHFTWLPFTLCVFFYLFVFCLYLFRQVFTGKPSSHLHIHTVIHTDRPVTKQLHWNIGVKGLAQRHLSGVMRKRLVLLFHFPTHIYPFSPDLLTCFDLLITKSPPLIF